MTCIMLANSYHFNVTAILACYKVSLKKGYELKL